MSEPVMNVRQFRHAMGKFATGVTILSFNHDGQPAAMTANAFMSLSVAPPMVLIAARTGSRFAANVGTDDRFGVSFLRADQEELSRHFGGQPNPTLSSPFQLDFETPLIKDALLQAVVKVVSIFSGGDHLIYTAEVEHIREGEGKPLIFFSGKYKHLNALDPMECWKDYELLLD